MTLTPLGDSAVVVALGDGPDEAVLEQVRALAGELQRDPPRGVVDVVPAFATVTVFYDPVHVGNYATFCRGLESRAARAAAAMTPEAARWVEVPVCYGGEFGPDLSEVARRAQLSVEQVVDFHHRGEYRVQAIGFAPGFAYLSGLSEAIHTPRRATPRTQVPAGTVGIGGAQTGVYPLMTPGGWNLIGRTPLKFFDAGSANPALLRAGDRVRFRPITPLQFAAWN